MSEDEPVAAPDAGTDPATPPSAEPPRRRLVLGGVALLCLIGVVAAVVLDRRSDGPPEPPPGSWSLVPYEGLGAWVDVYDWTDEFTGGAPTVGLAEIEAMADAGVQTVFLQTGHHRSDAIVIEPERLTAIIDQAHEHDMHVVAWYLPTLVDVEEDLVRLTASAELPVDGLAVDIESVDVTDPVVRTERLLTLTDDLRDEVGEGKVMGGITLTPVHLEVLNREYWPGYPWPELGDRYDVILPMAYWSIRTGELRSGERYVGENLDRLAGLLGDADVPLHPIGGIADEATVADVTGMLGALTERGAIGGSLYDWATSTPAQWEELAPLRDLRSTGDG